MRLLLTILVVVGPANFAQAQNRASALKTDRVASERIEQLVDSIATAYLDSSLVAGLSVGVVHGTDTLVLKGYGLADLEYDIPTPPHGVYRIGSITKQFTAAAIMRLVQENRVDLSADITEYLPNLETRNRNVTVARLLDHTSGFQGYTEKSEFWQLAVQELPRDTLVTLIQEWPFWHEPGEQMIYNNSAYFLLGLVIEAVADTTYEAFLNDTFFEPLGMRDSRYCSNTEIVRRRVRGYSWTPAGLRRANYLSHQWPYAAGSICSSVEDLLTWNLALHRGNVLSEDSYERMITPQQLSSGVPIRYAAGLIRLSMNGRPAIQHGGGINGFVSDAIVFPEDELIVVVLVNTTGPGAPSGISRLVVESILGLHELDERPLDMHLGELVGDWQGIDRDGVTNYSIRIEDGHLVMQRAENEPIPLIYLGEDWFSSASGWVRVGWKSEGENPELFVDSGYGFTVLRRAE